MDPTERDCDFVVDLESGNRTNLREMTTDPNIDSGFVIFENGATLVGNISSIVIKEEDEEKENVTSDLVEKSRNERRKTLSAKKPPRPPRPSKALSLDASDQKLIREFAELAMMKRARIERMKAIKKMKVSKGSSSNGNLLAMIITIIFCLVILFQGGCHGKSSAVKIHNMPDSADTTNSQFISLYDRMNSTKDHHHPADARSVEQVSGPGTGDVASRSSE